MAEDYGVTLKITADTSDLDQIQQKVDASRKEIEKPVEQPAPVKVNVEQPTPVKVPVEQPTPVKVPVEQPTPVKVPVEQPTPVKVPVEQPTPVKVPVEQPAPVKIEAKAEKVRVVVEDAEAKKRIEALTAKDGVKRIRVVTEGGDLAKRTGGKDIFELEVDAEKAKQTIAALKADARLKVTADTSAAEKSATSFFSMFRKGVSSIRSAISSVFAAFGVVTFVVMSVQSLIAGFQKLRDLITAIDRAKDQIRWDGWVNGFNAAADALIGKHQRIIALLKEEQDVASKAASLQSMARSQDRSQEDQARQQVRQQALAGETDPRKRQQLEDRFAAEDDEIARRRFELDRKTRIRQLSGEEDMYRAKENGARAKLPEIDSEIANQEEIVRKSRAKIKDGGDEEKYDKYIEDAQKRIAALKDEKKQTEELIETMKREADYRAEQAKIVEQSKAPVGGDGVRTARNRAQDAEDRRDQADFDRRRGRQAADADFDERFARAQRQASAPGATEDERNAAENTQTEMLRDRERQANEELAAAEAALAEEMRKDVQDRDERRIGQAREDITAAEGTARSARSRREALESEIAARRETAEKDYFGNLAREIESSRPQNRLTAMGLGSGVDAGNNRIVQEQASNVKLIAGICRDLLAATRAINVNPTSTFAD